MTDRHSVILIKNGRVFDLDGDVDRPPAADILIAAGKIAAIEPGLAAKLAQGGTHPALKGTGVGTVIDARDKLVVPGFINAHYHSHDVLLKGCFETIPLEHWVLAALPPSYPKRSRDEVRLRTLLGAFECLRSGMTTVQDLLTIYPWDVDHVDATLEAYEQIGIRAVFACQIGDVTGFKTVPFWEEMVPPEVQKGMTGAVEPFGTNIDLVDLVADVMRKRRDRHPRISWALGPTSPERCTPRLLERLGELARKEKVPIYTHLYELKAMTLIARQLFRDRDHGSLINYMERTGILGPQTSLAHSVWLLPSEIDKLAATGTNVVLNPVGNLKTKSGVAPIRRLLDAGVNVALGSDNCSCSDAQNMFQAMKMFTTLAAVSDPEQGAPTARDALHAATRAGARTAGRQAEWGALKPGMAADLSLLDLTDPSFVPMNSAARQLVYTECGRAVDTVLVDGQVVMRERKLTMIDEEALRREIEGVMKVLRKDIDQVASRNVKLFGYLDQVVRRIWAEDIGTNRYVANGLG